MRIISYKMIKLLSTIILSLVLITNGFRIDHQSDDNFSDGDDCSKPLFLTPYINAGEIEKAQNLSRVKPLNGSGNLLSYSGYLTVDKKCNSNLFFWFFPAKTNYKQAPVVVWLQGGPGGSSMFGLFAENGPFYVTDKLELKLRDYSWNSKSSMLYIDNPVGTGYSFTEKDECYATNQDDVRKNLYDALIQFFKLFPQIQKNDFYLTGESYAGKYVPAIAYSIHENNKKSPEIKINLRGLGIGNGWTDPVHMLEYDKYLYQLGLLDENQAIAVQKIEDKSIEYINKQEWRAASKEIDSLMEKIINFTGELNIYNYVDDIGLPDYYTKYITSSEVKCAIHVGKQPFQSGSLVYDHLFDDIPKSVKKWIEILVEHYKILFYSGQTDIIVAYPLTENFIRHLNWSGADGYKNAKRLLVNDKDNNFSGFIKSFRNLHVAYIRAGGHMIPADQPAWAYEFLERFLLNDTRNESD